MTTDKWHQAKHTKQTQKSIFLSFKINLLLWKQFLLLQSFPLRSLKLSISLTPPAHVFFYNTFDLQTEVYRSIFSCIHLQSATRLGAGLRFGSIYRILIVKYCLPVCQLLILQIYLYYLELICYFVMQVLKFFFLKDTYWVHTQEYLALPATCGWDHLMRILCLFS